MHTATPAGIDRWTERAGKLSLVVGALAFAAGVAAATLAPARGYEVSIYAATPTAFWVGVAIALAVALAVAFGAGRGLRRVALGLAVAAMFAVVALPLLRGYYFYGTADPLTHLGWARRLDTAALAPTGLLYPAVHTVAVEFGRLAGWPVRRALMVATVAPVLGFFLFVPLVVDRLAEGRPYAVAVGTFSALLLVPVNHISMFLRTHPFSQTTMYTALVVLALVAYLQRVDADRLVPVLSAEGAVLSLVAAVSTLYHPQLAADLLVVFAVASALQLGSVPSLPGVGARLDDAPRLYGPTVVFGLGYAAWALPSTWFPEAVGTLTTALVGLVTGSPPEIGDRVASQSASLLAVGSGPVEIFLKLFVPTTVYAVLAAAFSVALLGGSAVARRRGTAAAGRAMLVGGAVAFGFVVVYFLASVSEMYFRHLGLLMLFGTVLGALALVRLLDAGGRPIVADGGRSPGGRRLVLACGLAVLLALSGAVAYQSPYMYKANQHVTEPQEAGYEWAYEHRPAELTVAGLRDEARRFHDALYDDERPSPGPPTLSGEAVTTLPSALSDGGYLVLTDRSVQRETDAYRELRFSREQLRSVRGQRGVDRVMTNGDARVYHVAPPSEDDEEEA